MTESESNLMIRTVDMRVDYDDTTAVQDMNLSIAAGEVFGLIGPNGAGKTSTIRVLATLLEPTYGDVFIGGHDVAERADEVHKILGYMPDMAPVYDELRVWEFLDLFGAAHFVSKSKRRERIEELLHKVDLWSKRDAMAGTLSRGMKQRVCLAKTLLHDPKVLLLDEPASGIDPRGRIQMRDVLKGLGREGKTVLISSHILTEMSDFCTSVGIMEKGRLMISGRVEDIVAEMRAFRRWTVELIDVPANLVEIAKAHSHVNDAVSTDHRLEIDFSGTDHDAADLLAHLMRERVPVKAFYEAKMTVEDILMKLDVKEVS